MEINGLVAETVEQLKTELGRDLQVKVQPLPLTMVDAVQFKKVLVNLLLNAKEATDERGVVKVSTRPSNGSIVLSVRDDGRGMSREFMERQLFHPFQTTKKQGMGIGLFQSKKIVEEHGGRIEVESKEGKGTTFRVYLPAGDRNSTVNTD
jgi:signal transduction histidine kinase